MRQVFTEVESTQSMGHILALSGNPDQGEDYRDPYVELNGTDHQPMESALINFRLQEH